ncbi:leucyl-tRNA synthetase [Tilletiaria anomala UBC 951]|uniref:leucine--tRNA ligase n=1 Tax=Tilletiaria anomala (strain ATCC 24038 / CBS 436.72 / UBC 951) TaxID=1037660 RepID=A0A066W652_TILAU|nr:leucyl-tRNA synthetase [Tilletiaria anomala UBC 951]KDN49221.1 leucyl-tRNA synthetase [Tilletiaria anomala UBC 951]
MPPKAASAAGGGAVSAPPNGAAAAGPIQLENTSKRDFLIGLEKKYQKQWADAKLFEINSPMQEPPSTSTPSPTGKPALTAEEMAKMTPEQIREHYPKWMGTIPYPYMNGSLHLGHAFTISKIEFTAGFERMEGKRALFPFAFHATGMPIRAAADKLIREIEMFGKDFSGFKPAVEEEAPDLTIATATSSAPSGNVAKATKGKLAAKSTGLQYQFQILESIGVPREEIHKFADTTYWLKYFPPIAVADLNAIGARIDWRRAFTTTDYNPYYDSFVRWQINKLRALDKIKFGERYTIYSPKDGQPCMDHDRSEGESLGPQEYTALKMEVIQWGAAAAPIVDAITTAKGKKVYMVAATLRPETMYGQTNCYVGPNLSYGLFAINDTDIYLCTDRAARNMAFQGITKERGTVEKIDSIKGSDLVGTKINAPFAHYGHVYVLPMETVLATKGTGVVTSVPSDSPDDYATMMDLRKKAEYYNIDPQWVSLDPFPVLSTPAYGNLTAEALIKQLKIQSPKDVKLLAEAKELAYKEGFYNGTMLVGSFKGESVQDAKPKVREEMIKAGLAFAYAEPEGRIISRSADECVVALCDQWYLDYGEEGWKKQALELVKNLNLFTSETRNGFEGVLGWLHQWACARSYGLGTKLPWDHQFLVESLSDSTIYMAYYSVAHLLQAGVIDGSKVGPIGIKVEQLTDEVWEYIFGDSDLATLKSTDIPHEKLETLRREFRYFYPMDLRSSGKDLIPNHLTFCVYNHAALFPKERWPLAMRANGHLMLNGKKMSKSTGNSMTLRDGVEKFGADATRISLADAGDGIEDANFEEKSANANILRLHTLIEWCQEIFKDKSSLRTGPKDSFWDVAFENEINNLISLTYGHYKQALYKDAVKDGFYEMITARDLYRDATYDIKMHADLVEYWLRMLTLAIAPIAPHMAEHFWMSILGEKESIQVQKWPKISKPVNPSVTAATTYARNLTKRIRDAEILASKKKAGKPVSSKKAGSDAPTVPYDDRKPKELRIFIAKNYPEWQTTCVDAIKVNYDPSTGAIDDVKVREALGTAGLLKAKHTMPFVMAFKRRMEEFGPDAAFNRLLPFDEVETVQGIKAYLCRTMKFQDLHIESAEDALAKADELEGKKGFELKTLTAAEPGVPSYAFYNTE